MVTEAKDALKKNTLSVFLFFTRKNFLEFLLPGGNDREIEWLLSPSSHMKLLKLKRDDILRCRIRLFSGLFAFLVPAWGILDVIILPREDWVPIVIARLCFAIYLAMIFFRANTSDNLMYCLSSLILAPMAMFVMSCGLFSCEDLENTTMHAYSHLYKILPFITVAGIAIFPLTLKENSLLSFIVISMVSASYFSDMLRHFPGDLLFPLGYLLVLLVLLSAFVNISQLAGVITLVRNVIIDNMTGCYSRAAGEELVTMMFDNRRRLKTPFCAAFIDIDKFKSINDEFGHEVGDATLKNAASMLQESIRANDRLIRWGGEEFLLLLNGTKLAAAVHVIERIRTNGLGLKPTGEAVTASIGLVECNDGHDCWSRLIDESDSLMYLAKSGGRNKVCY